MIVRLHREMKNAPGVVDLLAPWITPDRWRWHETTELNLVELTPAQLAALHRDLEPHGGTPGVAKLRRELSAWQAMLGDKGNARPKNLVQFEAQLRLTLARQARPWLYRQRGEGWLACYVDDVQYHPPERTRDGLIPERCSLRMVWEELGTVRAEKVSWGGDDVRGLSVVEALTCHELGVDTPERHAAHQAEMARYRELVPAIGRQLWARGVATDEDCDGNPESRGSSWWWSRTNEYRMERAGQPTRVVVDVFREDDAKEDDHHRSKVRPDRTFWARYRKGLRTHAKDEDGELEWADDGDEPAEASRKLEIPVHPKLVVFDMSKHLRLKIHVGDLEDYAYDPGLIDKLILPTEMKSLVMMLVEHKSSTFTDVVRGKLSGAVVLLAGPPGCGKTLTAEVFSESEGRPLYSVQCSQLGTDPQALEDELLKVFARATRWGAIMLLDEADVYVHERGNDLAQNAIVGVFLRVLEYQNAVLFLTTNRPDDVDDAIASRCIARVTYQAPDARDQERIWRVLADASGASLADKEIARIVKAHPNLSGRDVKNLLKLAMLMRGAEPIDLAAVTYAQQFKPTQSQFRAERAAEKRGRS